MYKILVPTDGSDFARRGLEKAVEYAEKFPAEITLLNVQLDYNDDPTLGRKAPLHIVDDKYFQEAAEEILKGEADFAGSKNVAVKTAVAFGNPADQIVKYADENKFDMIVIGSEGLSGIKRFLLGSVANRVVAHAHCSVLVIKLPN